MHAGTITCQQRAVRPDAPHPHQGRCVNFLAIVLRFLGGAFLIGTAIVLPFLDWSDS
jgi:hypothetical protein